MKILVTGGTVFASRFTAEYFSAKGNEVYVLNRGTRPQSEGVTLIRADRQKLKKDELNDCKFDAVLDICAYNGKDVKKLVDALGEFGTYILVSSSAVYPETMAQPFREDQMTGMNTIWGKYGTDKIAAEHTLLDLVANAYIIRPPYLYGKMNNLYREAFVFDCAEKDLPFYVPKDGKMPLQFFDIEDMCRFMEILLEKKPQQRKFNVGNPVTVDVLEWVTACYAVLGKKPEFRFVTEDIEQREYFPFYDYGYKLKVELMSELMSEVKPLEKGLEESYRWYAENRELVRVKPLLEFISENFK
ncbi:MAG: NAD-dependent epimerase/dehydratase family protein [Oscillospiraceae bacterium]|nr:NAD-dependent epimerase/dehydratase family protein [Oscillospiraceae bacterium]